jgi:hypothetical protein
VYKGHACLETLGDSNQTRLTSLARPVHCHDGTTTER